MKKLITTTITAIVLSMSFLGSVSATTYLGTGNNFGHSWQIIGNTILGTGNNFGSSYHIIDNQVIGSGNAFGNGFLILD